MSIPDFQSLMRPLLESIADGQSHSNREIETLLANQYQLTSADLDQMLPSGQQPVFFNRVQWAKSHLKKAGLLESPARGLLRITEQGRIAIAQHAEKINIRYLKRFASYDWYKKAESTCGEQPLTVDDLEESRETPEELLYSSFKAIRESLANELLEKLKTCSPSFFEHLVVEVLRAMGYGGSLEDAGQVIGRTGDGGIDGIIKEDRLGLDEICIQAKRWPENIVGRPVVQAFVGSMEGYRAKKGVLLTTSAFSKDAHDYVTRIERKIVLIDGIRLAQLMIDHDVGVTTIRSLAVKKLDSDYFVEEMI